MRSRHQCGNAVSGNERRPRHAAHHVCGDRLRQGRLRVSRRCVYDERALRQRDLPGHAAELWGQPQSGRRVELAAAAHPDAEPDVSESLDRERLHVQDRRRRAGPGERSLRPPVRRARADQRKEAAERHVQHQPAAVSIDRWIVGHGTASAASSGATPTTTATAVATSASAAWTSTPLSALRRRTTVCWTPSTSASPFRSCTRRVEGSNEYLDYQFKNGAFVPTADGSLSSLCASGPLLRQGVVDRARRHRDWREIRLRPPVGCRGGGHRSHQSADGIARRHDGHRANSRRPSASSGRSRRRASRRISISRISLRAASSSMS